jgi:hypothetical protein
MKKTTIGLGLLTVAGTLGLTVLAGAEANMRMAATNCAYTGMSPSSSWLNTATTTDWGTVVCALDNDLAYATIDNVKMWTTTAASYCSLRNTAGGIYYANSVTSDIHEWTTDRTVSSYGWSVYCSIQPNKRAYWMETKLK